MSEERSASVGRASTAARTPAEDPIATIERWTDSGADYRVVHLSDEAAVVDLTTCDGQPMERLESADPRLIEFLRRESD
ncbi:MAG: hypothetical protein ACJ766_17065 [Thermoleophilaceae bacterium]